MAAMIRGPGGPLLTLSDRSGDKNIVFRLYAVENKIIGELTHAADEWKEPNKQ
jgi:hypothetical protein